MGRARERVPLSKHARVLLRRELAHYMTALNVDSQFAVRKCVFLIRAIRYPERLSATNALHDLEVRLAKFRELGARTFGRPWSFTQLRKCYWARAKRFIRRPVMPMTAEEWRTYQPTVTAEQALALSREFHSKRRAERQKAMGL